MIYKLFIPLFFLEAPLNTAEGPIVYLVEGRSPTRYIQRFCIQKVPS